MIVYYYLKQLLALGVVNQQKYVKEEAVTFCHHEIKWLTVTLNMKPCFQSSRRVSGVPGLNPTDEKWVVILSVF